MRHDELMQNAYYFFNDGLILCHRCKMLRTGRSIYSMCSRGCWPLQPLVYRPITKAASKNVEASSPSLDELNNHPRIAAPVIDEAMMKAYIVQDASLVTDSLPQPEVITPSKLTKYYSSLAKFRLTGLVVCSAVTGYAMAPFPTDLTTMSLCLLGTALTSASANTINQFFEVPFDSQMARTSNRVLVRGLLR